MSIKVLHVNRNYIFNRLHQLLIEHLDKTEEITNKVFVPTSFEQEVQFRASENVIVSKCFKVKDRYFYFSKQRKMLKALHKNYNVHDFDIIHAYTLFTDGGCAYNLHRKSGKPYVVAIRNTDINDFLKKIPLSYLYGKRIMESAEAVFFLSESYKQFVESEFLSEADRNHLNYKMVVIPNGLDPFWLENRFKCEKIKTPKEDSIRLIYAGRIDDNKNIEATAKAAEILIKDGYSVRFTIIGKVESQDVYRRLLNNYSFVVLKAEMPKEQLIYEYRNNDVFVMPSFTETFGISYVEAMSQGLPVIYTAGQGFDNQFDEGTVGYHVDPNNFCDIAGKVQLIMNDYNRLSERCIKESAKYDWSIIANQYVEMYKRIKRKYKNETTSEGL